MERDLVGCKTETQYGNAEIDKGKTSNEDTEKDW